jgi:hypothetical protein
MFRSSVVTFWIIAASAACTSALADIDVSKQPTQNMSCSAGVCTPTAPKAVLNVHDLTNMLASGDLAVQSGNGNGTAAGIEILNSFSWTNSSRLTLSAKHNIVVKAPLTVAGTGALTITYGKGNPDSDLLFEKKGKINFWDANSSLIINGNSYTLVADIATLANDITASPSANYALANDLDESGKTYKKTPVSTPVAGALTGLGHVIANFSINVGRSSGAFIYQINTGASLRDISFQNMNIIRAGRGLNPGALVQDNRGTIANISVTGQLWGDYYAGGIAEKNESTGIIDNANVSATISGAGYVGGIAGENDGVISNSSASGSVQGGLPTACLTPYTGGLVGVNGGSILMSRASNAVNGGHGEYKQEGCEIYAKAGGLVGYNGGLINQAFATGNVIAGDMSYGGGLAGYTNGTGKVSNSYSLGAAGTTTYETRGGGFAGYNTGPIATSYSIGAPSGGDPDNDCRSGGFIGCDGAAAGSLTSTYWDFDTSGISDPSRGAGDPANDPGIIGLTDAQLKSGLPDGFDPEIWGQSPSINNGYPYLIANPPPK